jgi:hypothetical protein
MYLPIDYNCFVSQLYHKTKIICKKRVTCKKKQGDFNFALQSGESDFSRYGAIISPTLPGLVIPVSNGNPRWSPLQVKFIREIRIKYGSPGKDDLLNYCIS